MIRINLLPVREWRKREAVRQQISIYLLSLLLLLCIILGAWITVRQQVSAKEQQVAALQSQLNHLNVIKHKINAIKRAKKEIEARFNVIEKLQANRQITTKLLDEIVTALPIDRLCLKHLSIKKSRLRLSGVALDNHTVALYMRRLKTMPLFKSVELENTRRQTVNGQSLMGFSLVATVQMSADKNSSAKMSKH